MNKSVSFLSLNVGNPSLERAKKQCRWLEKREEDVFDFNRNKGQPRMRIHRGVFFAVWV